MSYNSILGPKIELELIFIQFMTPQELDRSLVVPANLLALEAPKAGWLKTVRQAVGIRQAAVAEHFKVTCGAVSQIERSEADRTIQLKTLDAYAEAYGCQVVYCLVPNASVGT